MEGQPIDGTRGSAYKDGLSSRIVLRRFGAGKKPAWADERKRLLAAYL